MKNVKVKRHNKVSKKTGKVFSVKEHSKSLSKIEKIKNFRRGQKVEAMKFAVRNRNNSNPDVFNSHSLKMKNDAIKFAIKDLHLKNNEDIKRISEKLFKPTSTELENLSKKFNISRKTKEQEKTKFKYFFGNGGNIDKLIRSKKSISEGDVFYNQKLNPQEVWKETLKRKDLEIIQVGKKSDSGYNVKIMHPEKGKLKIKNKVYDEDKIFNFLKFGRKIK